MRLALRAFVTALLFSVLVFAAPSARAAAPSIELRSWAFGSGGARIELPAHLDDRVPQAPSTSVLTTRVTVPPDLGGKPLTFAFQELRGTADLEVDGVPATQLDVHPLERYRTAGAARWRVPAHAAGATMTLRLSIHHRWRASEWIDAVPVLTTDPAGGARLVAIDMFNRAAAAVGLGTNALVVLLYGFLWLSVRGPRRQVHGAFALGAAAMMMYPAFLLGLTQPIFGLYEPQVVAASIVVGAVIAVYFTRAYYELGPPNRAWLVWLGMALAITAASYDPFRAQRGLAPVLIITTSANALVQLVLLFQLRRREPRPRNVLLIVLAWPATAVLGFPDFFAWLGRGELLAGLRTACLGMAMIAVSQAMALLRDFVRASERGDELNTELAARVAAASAKQREVELLNDELRRQIAARTRQLAVSLAETEAVLQDVKLEPGASVEDRYVVVRLLGEGGMGAVYEIERILDRKHFALKLLTGVATGDPFARARFAREAEIAANVKHPNVVSLIDFDIAREGYLFLVMEFVEGSTLHEVRRRNHDVPWTLNVLSQVASGLEAIHQAGIVHRDLKPANVLLSRGMDGRRPLVKITDFGVSSLLSDEGRSSFKLLAANPHYEGSDDHLPVYDDAETRELDRSRLPLAPASPIDDGPTRPDPQPPGEVSISVSVPVSLPASASSPVPGAPSSGPALKHPKAALTQTGVIFGTPNYMAPELTRGTKTATRAADVFSLGVIAFELLTFRRPFVEPPVQARQRGKPLVPAPRFGDVCPPLPRELATLLDRALGHAPDERPTAGQLEHALRAACERLGGVPSNPPPSDVTGPTTAPLRRNAREASR